MVDRALSPVVGVVCLLAVTVVLATVVGATAPMVSPSIPTTASFSATAEPTGELTVTHQGGDSIAPAAIDLRIHIEDEPLETQPPVPFFSARGFESGPTGPFNSATTGQWRAGETAALRIAGTNSPTIQPGDTVTIGLYADGDRVTELETTA
ncbi:MAG: type IV pilin [Natronomonas sp.]